MRLWPAHARGEEGFSIAETVVAAGLSTLLVATGAMALNAGIRSVHSAKLTQQATAVGNQVIEELRNVSHATLAMESGDLNGDARIKPGPAFDPDGSGPLAQEPVVVVAAGGAVVPHIEQRVVSTSTFTVARYVTWVDSQTQGGPDNEYKRVTVIVSWKLGAKSQQYSASTLVTKARRGLPIPKFDVEPRTQSKTVMPGNTVVFAHTIHNRGIIDAYDLTMPSPPGRTWAVTFYKDVNANGTYELGTDTLLVDTNATGVVDTGNIDTNQSAAILAVWTLASNEATGTASLTLTVKSGASPSVTKTATDTLTVGSPGIELYLHNHPTPPTGNTTAQTNTRMDPTAPTGTVLHKYSNNLYTAESGRFVDKSSPSATQNNASLMMSWVYQAPQSTTYNGTARVSLWVAQKDLKCDKTVHLRFYLREKTSASTPNGTVLATADATSAPSGTQPCQFRLVETDMAVDASIASNRWLELKVVVKDETGDAALLAYDTTVYPSKLRMPQVAV